MPENPRTDKWRSWCSRVMGERYQDVAFDSFVGHPEALATVQDFTTAIIGGKRPDPPCLCLYGLYGTGKTHLLISAARALFLAGKMGKFYRGHDLHARIKKEAYGPGSHSTVTEVIRLKIQDTPCVIIDDIGIRLEDGVTASDAEISYLLFDELYNRMTPCLLATNLDLREIKAALGPRVFDRLREMAKFLNFDWDSYRKKEGAK